MTVIYKFDGERGASKKRFPAVRTVLKCWIKKKKTWRKKIRSARHERLNSLHLFVCFQANLLLLPLQRLTDVGHISTFKGKKKAGRGGGEKKSRRLREIKSGRGLVPTDHPSELQEHRGFYSEQAERIHTGP